MSPFDHVTPMHRSCSDDESESVQREAGEEGDVMMGEEERGEVEAEVSRINVEIPRCLANLGTDQHFVKLPNFLSVETR